VKEKLKICGMFGTPQHQPFACGVTIELTPHANGGRFLKSVLW
jgi:hypothetical protein